jgi:hypothetical protein
MKNIPTYITSLGLLLAALIPVHAESILIDLSNASAVTNPAGDGKNWNTLGDNAGGNGAMDASIPDLVDSNNTATGFGLAIDVTNIQSGGTSGAGFGGTGINGPSGADPFDESAAITDGLFNNNATNGTAVFVFTGLTANAQYDFSAIGGRASSGVDGQIVILDSNSPLGTAAVTTQTAYTLLNNGTVLNFSAISNASGEIFFEFRRNDTSSTSGGATINALSITEPLSLIQSFSTSDTSVVTGTQVTLSWAASNYDTLVIQPGNIDAAALSTNGSGSTQVTVNATTTYTLTASFGGSDQTRSVEITALADEPIIQSFTSSDSSVETGTQVTLSWAASNYDTLVIEPGNINAAALSTNGSGSTMVTLNDTTTYTLTANKGGTETSSDVEVSIQVDNPNTLDKVGRSLWTEWYRPVDSPVFSTSNGNNHDPIIFYEPTGSTYKYYLIISHESSNAFLWGANSFSWDSADWTLISGNYQINSQYEYDDAVKVGGTYYIYEDGKVLTYTGDLVNSSGNWANAGTFPKSTCDDIGVFYENGLFHIFGENGVYPDGFDGLRLSHYTSTTGVGDWTLVSTHAVDPNPDGGSTYGVGDPTIAKIGDVYYLFCDRESIGSPYRVTAWSSTDINQPFEYLGVAMAPRSDETDDWDNYRIQDADIQYIPELKRFIMVCNMMDTDGTNPDGIPPFLPNNTTRVVGTFYSQVTDGGFDAFMAGFLGLTGADALVGADPDLDGASNGEEYAGGSLPNDPSSFPQFGYAIVEDGGISYPAITFDRITIDSGVSRSGEVSNAGSLLSGAFSVGSGTEIQTGISEAGALYEEVQCRSTTRVDASDAQFLRVKTTISDAP